MVLFCKLCWNFRTRPSICSEYMRNKYRRNIHFHAILWKTGGGGSQTGLGDLYTITREDFAWDDTYKTIHELTRHGESDTKVLNEILPHKLVNHILQNIQPSSSEGKTDKPCWMLETRGEFTIKSSWHYIRHKEEENKIYK
ncbi:hypothetical protein H5410_052624 [Solanum commersonii]|uniref:Uncharacterized protein n=1 Tax=Solanum commersonii TaxID=4109 RepID=A0A9J5X3K2_SOLCO|nr:hypothetical protein H5410_052624 [Solanum commersonii]